MASRGARGRRRILLLGAAVVLSAATLTSCTARTEVNVTVRAVDAADVVIAAEFTAEAAAVLHAQPDTLAELTATFAERTGSEPEVTSSPTLVRVTAPVDYAHLTQAGGITGVGEVRLAAAGEDVQASVELRDAPDLREAVVAATASQPDAGAVSATMAQGTQLVLTLTFPGGLVGSPQLVGVSSSAMSVDGTSVTVVRSLDAAVAGAVVVTGDPQAPPPWLWIGGGSLAAVVACAAVVAYRRDQADPATARRN